MMLYVEEVCQCNIRTEFTGDINIICMFYWRVHQKNCLIVIHIVCF